MAESDLIINNELIYNSYLGNTYLRKYFFFTLSILNFTLPAVIELILNY